MEIKRTLPPLLSPYNLSKARPKEEEEKEGGKPDKE